MDNFNIEDYHDLVKKQKSYSGRNENQSYKERLDRLKRLKRMLVEKEGSWMEALNRDLGKSPIESYTSELALLLNEIDTVIQKLNKWMKPKKSTHISLSGVAKSVLRSQPYGSILVLSPWNYPLQLTLMPVIGALAAGNSCVIKPSEFASATAKLLADSVKEYFKPEEVTVIEGDSRVAESLLTLDWDFIFFTGSKRVGKIVHQAAAEKQIPVVLELGGKNPCIVDETGLSKETIRQIIWGKFVNAGQTCIAPDTIYVHESIYTDFLTEAAECIEIFYGKNPEQSPDYSRIIHQEQLKKQISFLNQGTVYHGGRYNLAERYVEPTLLVDLAEESAMMKEEIFGPIMPVIPYSSIQELKNELNQQPVPLAAYVFSENQDTIRYLEKEIRSSAFSLNQVIRHAAHAEIPFGGLKESGFGSYHGLTSFETFSFQKVFYEQKNKKSLSQQYPPYRSKQLDLLRKFRKRLF